MTEKLNTGQVCERLRQKYGVNGRGYIYMEELGNATGTLRGRIADGVAVGVWPSTGYEIMGFEVKVSRQDLVKELNDFRKWESVGRYCHRWWLVVGDKSIVKIAELPVEWGVMYPTKTKLKVMRPAQKLSPVPVDMPFLCSMLCKLENRTKDEFVREYNRGRADGIEAGKLSVDSDAGRWEKSVKAFEEKSGIKIGKYNGEHIGTDFAKWEKDKGRFNRINMTILNFKHLVEGGLELIEKWKNEDQENENDTGKIDTK